MKIRKLRLTLFILVPYLVLYLMFAFTQFTFDASKWGDGRGFYMMLLSFIVFLQFMYLFTFNSYGEDNYFTQYFQYDKLEEMEKKNKTIREMNKLAKEQLELLKYNDNIRAETKDLFSKNKI